MREDLVTLLVGKEEIRDIVRNNVKNGYSKGSAIEQICIHLYEEVEDEVLPLAVLWCIITKDSEYYKVSEKVYDRIYHELYEVKR